MTVRESETMIPEAKAYLDSIEGLHRATRRAIEGLDADCLNWNPLPGEANSIYAIVAHMCASEPIMVHQRIDGGQTRGNYVDAFAESGDDPKVLLDELDRVGGITRSLMEGVSTDDLERSIDPGGGRPARTVREWIGVHIRHLANHVGHVELTKQLYEAGVGR